MQSQLVNIKHLESKGMCTRCGGSGKLLRPHKRKLLTFIKCTNCQGNGFRFKQIEKSYAR